MNELPYPRTTSRGMDLVRPNAGNAGNKGTGREVCLFQSIDIDVPWTVHDHPPLVPV
jgi:hypothetical protein